MIQVFSDALKSCVFIKTLQQDDKRLVLSSQRPLKNLSPLFWSFILSSEYNWTCRVPSSPCHSLPTSLLSSLRPGFGHTRTRQICDTNVVVQLLTVTTWTSSKVMPSGWWSTYFPSMKDMLGKYVLHRPEDIQTVTDACTVFSERPKKQKTRQACYACYC